MARTRPEPCVGGVLGCAVLLLLGSATAAKAQVELGLPELVAKVDPAVVRIVVPNQSQGSGFVVDSGGTILTNYHVIEGAPEATVFFLDKSSFRVEGFLKIAPGKDLALLRIQPGGKPLPCLKVAAAPPAKGDKVFAFGAPMGMGGSLSDGIVSAMRPGEDVRNTLRETTKKDIYVEVLGYDLDVKWIQMTAPISPGNSGGPLVNSRGEVVGINTWCHILGQNLNFAVSSESIQPFLATAASDVQPLTALPKPRAEAKESWKGDAKRTLAVWNQVNVMKIEFSKHLIALDKRAEQVSPLAAGRPTKSLAWRRQKMVGIYADLARVYLGYANELRALDLNKVDPELILLTIAEADLAQRFSGAQREYAAAIATDSFVDRRMAEFKLERLNTDVVDLRTARDLLKVRLGNKYEMSFPAPEAAMREAEAAESDAAEPADDGQSAEKEPARTSAAAGPGTEAKRAVARVWSDRTGQFQVQAKYLGTSEGKVKLQKADGSVINVPLEKLSEADQRFIGADKAAE